MIGGQQQKLILPNIIYSNQKTIHYLVYNLPLLSTFSEQMNISYLLSVMHYKI